MSEPTPTQEESQKKAAVRPGIARIGAVLSICYLASLLIYAIVQRRPFLGMLPNEFADFLAGAFAPLAFLWLVLGFIQQGQELRISSDALRIQGDELRASVEQQRQLVEVSRLQLESEAEARRQTDREADQAAAPRLHFTRVSSTSGSVRKFTFTLHNGGPACSDVEVDFFGSITRKPILGVDGQIHWQRDFPNTEALTPFDAEVFYVDRRGNRRSQTFRFAVDPTGGPMDNGTYLDPVRIG